jgi:hypothetical protein
MSDTINTEMLEHKIVMMTNNISILEKRIKQRSSLSAIDRARIVEYLADIATFKGVLEEAAMVAAEDEAEQKRLASIQAKL